MSTITNAIEGGRVLCEQGNQEFTMVHARQALLASYKCSDPINNIKRRIKDLLWEGAEATGLAIINLYSKLRSKQCKVKRDDE